MDDFKKVSINKLAVYLSNVYSKLENRWYSQEVNDWMDKITLFEQNSIYDSYYQLSTYDNIIYNKNGEAERLTIGFKNVYFADGTVDIEYYLPKSVDI